MAISSDKVGPIFLSPRSFNLFLSFHCSIKKHCQEPIYLRICSLSTLYKLQKFYMLVNYFDHHFMTYFINQPYSCDTPPNPIFEHLMHVPFPHYLCFWHLKLTHFYSLFQTLAKQSVFHDQVHYVTQYSSSYLTLPLL